jgi:hypothetical protein
VRRWLFTLLVLSVLGVVPNVAVAWGCALWVDDDFYVGQRSHRPMTDGYWEVFRSEAPGSTTICAIWHFVEQPFPGQSGPEPSTLIPYWCDIRYSTHGGTGNSFANARGWPLVSMSWKGSIASSLRFAGVHGAISMDRSYPGELGRAPMSFKAQLPLVPIWPSFAVNTLFYALVLWLPVCGPFALRRYVRRRRGRCTECGYPAGTSPTCTECGAVLAASKGRV